jgi:hypothetical protein
MDHGTSGPDVFVKRNPGLEGDKARYNRIHDSIDLASRIKDRLNQLKRED